MNIKKYKIMEYTTEINGIINTQMNLIRDNKRRLLNPSEPMDKRIEGLIIRYIKQLRESLLLIHRGLYNTEEYERLQSKITGTEKQLEQFELRRRLIRAYGSMLTIGKG